ncbi:YcbK family protein [Avibacterium sp. 21-586]|uniref:YcbK family protein n=1 Tax=Avibacterium sp. 21-586 TaxID=2911534 RepID=UPI0022457AFD|nr:YcbK family protein [Avibacterium sp. 21-586]MCW9709840.1 YcbK family protein [Avibacterium sp. 21-586]
MNSVNKPRRKWLSLGGIALGVSLVPNVLLAAFSTQKPRILRFRNINTGDTFSGEFSFSQGFSANNLKKLDYLLRDKRNNSVHRMDPRLFTKFYQIQNNLGLHNVEIQIICGYRSPASNAAMHRRSRGVASNSYHIRGQAIDFRIDGIPLARVKRAAESLNNGGVGYYPRSNFVHIDTGPVRTWRGS